MSWIEEHVQPGMLVVDVGANQGSITSELVKRGATVIAIEPHPEMAQALRDTYPTVTVIEAAACDHSGMTTYYHSRDSVHGSLYKANILEDIGRADEVPAVMLDRVVPWAEAIKVDAQGAEAAILRGAQRLLARRRAVWFIELWKTGLDAAGDSVAAVRHLFEAHGYVPQGESWDAVQQRAERQTAHSAIDVVVLPGAQV